MRSTKYGCYVLVILMMVSCAGCWVFKDFWPGATGLYLAEWELKLSGYYTYVLPDDVVKEMDWKREIYMYEFGCDRGASDDHYNPIYTRYDNEQGDRVIDIVVFEDRVFGPRFDEEVFTTTIESKWIEDNNAELYFSERGFPIYYFTDWQGMSVTIYNTLEDEAIADLIAQIEYIGPDPETIGNP